MYANFEAFLTKCGRGLVPATLSIYFQSFSNIYVNSIFHILIIAFLSIVFPLPLSIFGFLIVPLINS